MTLSWIRAVRLLYRISRPTKFPSIPESMTLDSVVLPTGSTYDRFRSVRFPKAEAALIAVPGMVREGEKDPRLVRLATAFAQEVITVACPSLLGLKSFQLLSYDLGVLLDIIENLSSERFAPLHLMGFSFGAGPALTAACHPRAAGKVDTVMSFGAYHCLRRQWRDMCAADETFISNRDTLYRQLVLAYRNGDAAGFSPEEQHRVEALLSRYCFHSRDEETKRFVEEVLLPKRNAYYHPPFREADADALSSKNKLQDMRARVFLLHDPDDGSVSADHSRAIFEELTPKMRRHGKHQLLITKAVSHVDAGSRTRIVDLFRIVCMFAALLVKRECRWKMDTARRKP